MKISPSTLPAAILIASSFYGGAASTLAQAPAHDSSAQFAPQSTLGATWNEVRDLTRELDDLIAARKLSSVHEAAFNLRDSVRELRSDAKISSAVDAVKLDALIRQVDALSNALDASGDRNDLRATTKNQARLHVLLDQIAAVLPFNSLQPIGPIEARGAVKDPVCRMTVDAATAAAKVAFGGQTYYFCSVADAATFRRQPALYAQRYEQLAFGTPKRYTIGLHVDGRARSGQPIPLSFAVREAGRSQLVSQFENVHEKQMHLIAVSDDLSWFSHEHPHFGRDGRFRLTTRFPHAGRFWLFADFTPSGGNNQLIRSTIDIDGARPASSAPLTPDTRLSKLVDGYQISVQLSAPLRVGKAALLTYTITRDGQPVTDMQPYLGAMGHLMAIHQNGRDAIHTHTVEAGAGGAHGLDVSPSMATKSGPRFTYNVELPTEGLTKIWAQFQHRGRVITVPFTFVVAGKSPAVRTMTAQKPPQSTLRRSSGLQQVTITIDGGYQPGRVAVQAGRPLRLTFVRRETSGCGDTVVIPALKKSLQLKSGQSQSIQFTPQRNQSIEFSCGMGMYRGSLAVR